MRSACLLNVKCLPNVAQQSCTECPLPSGWMVVLFRFFFLIILVCMINSGWWWFCLCVVCLDDKTQETLLENVSSYMMAHACTNRAACAAEHRHEHGKQADMSGLHLWVHSKDARILTRAHSQMCIWCTDTHSVPLMVTSLYAWALCLMCAHVTSAHIVQC